jgi:hypothetical protein
VASALRAAITKGINADAVGNGAGIYRQLILDRAYERPQNPAWTIWTTARAISFAASSIII